MAYMPQAYVGPQVLVHPWQSAKIRIPAPWGGRAIPIQNQFHPGGPAVAPAPVGMGDYLRSDNWSWEFFPPPYSFLAPPPGFAPGQVAPEEVGQLGMSGFGCGGGSCSCGGTCHGMGDDGDASSLFYLPFQSSDISTWGWEEWALIFAGGYTVLGLIWDAGKGVSTVRKAARSRASKARRKQQLQQEMDLL
jgi:hypothetical protein